MQISDLLGKYGQNTVPVTAQEQAVKTGTQQLTGTLSSLQTGNVFEGTVTDISDGQVLLTLANGEKISARLEGQIQLQLNQAMFFEVKSNTQTQIAIKPYLNGDSSNPTLLKALMQAGMGVTTDNLEMVRTMMEEQLPIDKNSLNQMMRQLAMFPKAEPSVIAQMNKLGIPVTEANVQQFSNYKADTAAIMKELENVLEQLPKSIAGEGDTAGQMTAKNMQLMDILFGGETIEQSQDTGAKAQELLAKPAMERDVSSLNNRITILEKKIEEGNFTVNVGAAPQAAGSSGANPEPKPKKVFEKAIPEDVQYVVDNWGSVRRHISNPYKTFLQDARFSVKGENTLLIVFNPGAIGYEGCSKPEVIEMLNTLISEEIKKQVKVEVTMLENNQTFSDYYQEVVSKINMDIEEEDF